MKLRLWSRRTPAERWERKLLKLRRANGARRFIKNDNGSVTIVNQRHGLIGASFWQKVIDERRHPDVSHRFRGSSYPVFYPEDIKRQYPMREICCARCKDTRIVDWMMDPTLINDGWCK